MKPKRESSSTVIVVGSANLDLTVRTENLPAPGETVIGTGITRRPGGKGSNQAVAAALLGNFTQLVAAVGDDADGDFLRKAAAKAGVATDMIQCEKGCPTGTALITVDDRAENVIVVSPGANTRLTPRQVEHALSALGGPAVLCLSLEIPVATTLAAAKAARALGVQTLLNLSPYTPEARTILPLVDVVVLNAGEAVAAVGLRDAPSERPWHAVGALLTEIGVKNAVITLGADGAIVLESLQTWPVDPVHVEPIRITPTDTTGCGDAFAGALASEVAKGHDLVPAARFAGQVAAYAATGHGAQESYPTREQLQEWLEQRKATAQKDIQPAQ